MPEHSANSKLSNALIICDEGVDHTIFSRLLENNRFPVSVTEAMATERDLENYGAIIHIGNSQDLLEERLGSRLEEIRDEEWVFLAGGEASDLHCTVELTPNASDRLRRYIRLLWSQFSVT